MLSLALAALQVVGSFGAASNQPERRGIDALAVVLVLIGPVALAWRDVYTTSSAIAAVAAVEVYIARGYPYGPIFASVAVAFFHLAIHRSRRVSIAVASAAFAGYVVASALDVAGSDGLRASHLALVAGWLTAIVVISELVNLRRTQVVERRQAQERERERRAGEQRLELAQELHDVLAHNISLINVQASVALHLLATHPDRAEPALVTIKQASHEALRELRVALDVLRRGEAAPRSPAPTLADVPTLVENVRTSGLDATLEIVGEPIAAPAASELAAYRIIQEALTNVVRHARANAVHVRVAYGDGLAIDVTDDGAGTVAPTGSGITGMHERARSVGGHVEVTANRGRGVRVHARIPGNAP